MSTAKILSPQQTVVMQHIIDGHTVKETALLTQLAIATVRKHINKAKRKLGAKTQNHAVALAVAYGEVHVNITKEI